MNKGSRLELTKYHQERTQELNTLNIVLKNNGGLQLPRYGPRDFANTTHAFSKRGNYNYSIFVLQVAVKASFRLA